MFWGSGIGPRIAGSHSRKYVLICAYKCIYIQIHTYANIYKYTYIYFHILSCLMGTRSEVQGTIYVELRAYTYIYMHIHAYTILVGVCLYKYNFLINTYIYLHLHAYMIWKIVYARNGFLKFLHVYCTYIARICTYLLEYMHVFARMTDYIEIDTTNNFPYKNKYKIRTEYVHTCKYGRIYVYIRTQYMYNILSNKTDSI